MQPFQDSNNNGFVTYAGKLQFNYNPANGSNFMVKVTSTTNSFRWKYILAYPINGSSVGCVPPQQFYDVPVSYSPDWGSWSAWCGNGVFLGSGQILLGYSATWTPVPIPIPQTVVVPFDPAADWAGTSG